MPVLASPCPRAYKLIKASCKGHTKMSCIVSQNRTLIPSMLMVNPYKLTATGQEALALGEFLQKLFAAPDEMPFAAA